MRVCLAALACLALTTCDSGEIPTPSEQAKLRPSSPQVDERAILLRGEGLVAGTEAFYFAAGETEVRTALTQVLGAPQSITENEECGAGSMVFASFPGNLTVNFQEGRLVGWNAGEAGEQISVEGDVQIGMPEEQAQLTSGFAEVAESTLGKEFALGDKIGGFVEDGRVSMLYAGTQCFFR